MSWLVFWAVWLFLLPFAWYAGNLGTHRAAAVAVQMSTIRALLPSTTKLVFCRLLLISIYRFLQ